MSICSGAFALARAGLLDGRRCTTHWHYSGQLAAGTRRHRSMRMCCTSRTATSSPPPEPPQALMPACTWCGWSWARTLPPPSPGTWWFRRTATAARRSSSTGQCLPAVRRPWRHCCAGWWRTSTASTRLTNWPPGYTCQPRTFARRFRSETGATPAAWLNSQRVLRAQELLESTDLNIDEVARESGFGHPVLLRHHFAKVLDTSPQSYRRAFRGPLAEAGRPTRRTLRRRPLTPGPVPLRPGHCPPAPATGR